MSLSNMSRTISNIYTYSFNPQLVIKTQVENHDKEPKDRRNFYMWTIIFQKDRYISFLVTLFFNWSMSIYSKYKLHLQWSLYTGVHLLQFLNVVICTPIALFFKYIKPHQILFRFSAINLAQVLEINIFERDFSNLNNLFQIY